MRNFIGMDFYGKNIILAVITSHQDVSLQVECNCAKKSLSFAF